MQEPLRYAISSGQRKIYNTNTSTITNKKKWKQIPAQEIRKKDKSKNAQEKK